MSKITEQNEKSNQIKTHDDFVEKMAKIKPSIEVVGQYVNKKTKVRCKCRICGFEWESLPSTLYKGKGCLKCNGTYRRSREELIDDLEKINPTVEIVGEYINMNTKIDCRCRICGYEWSSRPASLMHGYACSKCANKKSRKLHAVFVDEVSIVLPNIDIMGTYEGNDKRIRCRCKTCGYEWDASPRNLRRGKGCVKCSYVQSTLRQRKPHEQFVEELKMINPMISITSKYLGTNKKINCKCKICGREWSALARDLLRGRTCSSCSRKQSSFVRTQTSFVEQSILLFLRKALGEENVLSRNTSIIGKELDIYIPSMKIGIEPGSWCWHKNKIDNDKEKHNLCRHKNIRLITIYDSFTDDKESVGIDNDDFITYTNKLGDKNRRKELKDCIINIFNLLDLAYTFSEDEENELFVSAKKATCKKNTEEIVGELAEINPNIELLGHYEDSKTKIPCRCKVCGHEWSQNTDHLILRKQGCPMCNRPHKKVINLDTGEMFESATDAASQLGLTPAAIATACRGINKTCNGHHWKYVQDLDK